MIAFVASPANFSASPTDLNLTVNNLAVQNWNQPGYDGNWLSSAYWAGTSGNIPFTFNCNWPNTSWIVNTTLVQYAYRIASNQSTFYIPNANSSVQWSMQYLVNNFNSVNYTNFGINFTIPQAWTPQAAYRDNGETLVTTAIPWDDTVNTQVISLNVPDPYGNNTWILNCTGTNIGYGLVVKDGGSAVSTAYYEDSLTPFATLTQAFDDNVYLDIFDPSGTLVYGPETQMNTATTQTFDSILASVYASGSYGIYTYQVWGSATDSPYAFLNQTQVLILANTTVGLNSYSAANNTNFASHATFNVDFNYTDSGKSFGIPSATVQCWNGSIGSIQLTSGSVPGFSITNTLNGDYQIAIPAAQFIAGTYNLTITANQTLSQNQTFYFSFTVYPPPAITSVNLSPSQINTDTSPTAVYSYTGVGTLDIQINWYVNSAWVYGNATSLGYGNFTQGTSITAQVSISDGTYNDSVTSASKTVQAAPTVPTVNIIPTQVDTDSQANVTYSYTGSGTLDIQINWYVNSAWIYGNATSLGYGNFTLGNTITVQVSVSDGIDNVSHMSGGSIVQAAPTVTGVSFHQLG